MSTYPEIRREMERLVARSMCASDAQRPELQWLKEQFDRFAGREGIASHKAADTLLYERLYGRPPQRETNVLKIRYWRTGRHLPVNYGQCLALGQALNLDREAQLFLMQGYYDSCDQVFSEGLQKTADAGELYQRRLSFMERLITRYLERVSPERLPQTDMKTEERRRYIRHLYYTDAMGCIHQEDAWPECSLARHASSVNYDSELNRTLNLLGVVPRKTIIRHLFILGMPDLSLDYLNRSLAALGYLPLRAGHTLRTGERLDMLLIGFLRLCEAAGRQGSPGERCLWTREALRILDGLLVSHGLHRQRFMHFKALDIL